MRLLAGAASFVFIPIMLIGRAVYAIARRLVPVAGRGFTGLRGSYIRHINESNIHLNQDPKILNDIADASHVALASALCQLSACAATLNRNSRAALFPHGDELTALLDELAKAKRFIFIECRILRQGQVFSEIFELLEAKAIDGLDVRIAYEGWASRRFLPRGFARHAHSVGIKCRRFNTRIRGFGQYHNRFMVIIDGNSAFTSSHPDLGDELATNQGMFRCAQLIVRGDAVWSLCLAFLNSWAILTKTEEDYTAYRPTLAYPEERGYIMAFTTDPANSSALHTAFIKAITSAQSYVYITTPAMAPPPQLLYALRLAAFSGIDVRILTSSATESSLADHVTKAYYSPLLDAGVRIYEYTESMLGIQSLVTDDAFGLVSSGGMGTEKPSIAVWAFADEFVLEIRNEFLGSLESVREVSPRAWYVAQGFPARLWHSILRTVNEY